LTPRAREDDSRGRGRRLRRKVGRTEQGRWHPAADRADPLAILQQSNAERLPHLVPLKMGRMALSPFGFFRGAAPVMAADLARCPNTGLVVQLCGDAHVQNIGAFGTPEGRLAFDLNDFDETILGPWEWDVARLAASVILAGREAGNGNRLCGEAVRTLTRSYRESMDRFSVMTLLDLARYEVHRHTKDGPVRAALGKAERATPAHAVEKLTVPTKSGRCFHDRPPLLCHVSSRTARAVIGSLLDYRETLGPDRRLVVEGYRPVDVAFKVVGTGSVGTRDYVVLFAGRHADDHFLLQVKEELPSCYVRYLPDVPPYRHQGQRVAEGQHRMQTFSDPFLGWTSIEGRDYLVRQLSDHKAKVELEDMGGAALVEYALVSGEILAKGHARTGDAAAIAGYCGKSAKLDKAMAAFALAYADQTEHDHERLLQAIKLGRMKAAPAGG
jgi:uncharacterized protein (DUF2252 family)